MGSLDHLFTPFTLGGVELPNRIVMLPMTTGYAERDQSIGDRLIDYYAARAKGGAGLIVAPFSPIPAGSPVDAGLYHDRFIPGAERLAKTVHEYGGKISAQLIVCYHLILPGRAWQKLGGDTTTNRATPVSQATLSGEQGLPSGEENRMVPDGAPIPVGPSPIMNVLLRTVPKELTQGEIAWIVNQHGEAARRAKQAGFDLVEVMAGGGYLVNRFLSPLSNTRTDGYGGNLQGRIRFLVEIIEAVRAAAGADFPVTVRLNLHENIKGGYGIDEALEIAKILEKTGVAGFTTYVGRHESPIPTVQASVPKGGFVHLVEELKRAVTAPVTAANRIDDPFVAARILAKGSADLVGMGRALLADPDLPRKARRGRTAEIVPCLACSTCLAAMLTTYKHWGSAASAICVVNPALGEEGRSHLEPVATAKKVAVVGGGPAGLEAAWAAAIRGHEVTLYDGAERAGGRLLLGSVPPFKETLAALADGLAARAMRAGVKMCLGRRADRQTIKSEQPDAVVIAIGGIPIRLEIPGADGPNVITVEELLTGKRVAVGSVLVIGGGIVGCEVAEYIWTRARAGDGTVTDVTVIEMLDRVAAHMPVTSRPFFLARLKEQQIGMLTGSRVIQISLDGLTVVRAVDGAEVTEQIPGDSVVLATGYQADSAAVAQFLDIAPETYVIVDSADPRTIREAIAEGFATGCSI